MVWGIIIIRQSVIDKCYSKALKCNEMNELGRHNESFWPYAVLIPGDSCNSLNKILCDNSPQ